MVSPAKTPDTDALEWDQWYTEKMVIDHLILLEDHLLDYGLRSADDQCLGCMVWHCEKLRAYCTYEAPKFFEGDHMEMYREVHRFAQELQGKLVNGKLEQPEAVGRAKQARELRYRLIGYGLYDFATASMESPTYLCEGVEMEPDLAQRGIVSARKVTREQRVEAERATDLLEILASLGGGVEASPVPSEASRLIEEIRPEGRVGPAQRRAIGQLVLQTEDIWGKHGIRLTVVDHLKKEKQEAERIGSARLLWRAENALWYLQATGIVQPGRPWQPVLLEEQEHPYRRERPKLIEVKKTTIEKHYGDVDEFHPGSFRVVKPTPDVLVYLACKKGDRWDPGAVRCYPNPSVHKTIVPNTPDYMREVDEWAAVGVPVKHLEVVGVEPTEKWPTAYEEDGELLEVVRAIEEVEGSSRPF